MRKFGKQGKKNEWERYLEYEIEDWIGFEIPANKVLVEIDPDETETTVGGIIVIKDQDFAAHADRRGIVRKVPRKLTCVLNDPGSMSWECDMDLQVGDEVWMTHVDSYNAFTFNYGGVYMRLVDYAGMLVAKRGDRLIMCNGYVLLEKIMNVYKFGKYEREAEDKNFAIVKAVGKPNRKYKTYNKLTKREEIREDSQIELKEGDKVFIEDHSRVFDLEDFSHAVFDDRKIYKLAHRRRIGAVLIE
jgi:co-chaperonin GroES (HSP10)